MTKTLKIGTRGSRLALFQTHLVADLLRAAHPGLAIEIVEIKTSGDWTPAQGETRLSAVRGGKGLFAKEIEQALTENRIDCGVHSMKDMPSFLPDGLMIRHMLKREDTRDAFLANTAHTLDDLPRGAVVGTSSTRRAAFLLAKRPDLQIVPLRGNVPTRIEKLRAGQVNATILALAGLNRLELTNEIASIIDIGTMLPAAGQGAIGIEMRKSDGVTRALFDDIHCRETGLRVGAERAALATLDGSCHTPIGAHAVFNGDQLRLHVVVASLDGQVIFEETQEELVQTESAADALGHSVGQSLKDRLPPGFLS